MATPEQHMKSAQIVTSLGIGAALILVYLGGFVQFTRHHGAMVSAATGELVYIVPDTAPYRLLASLYAPLLYVSHKRITPDARAR